MTDEPKVYVAPYRLVGISKDGVKRVWGEADTYHKAMQECLEAIREYIGRRPEMGPASDWSIRFDKFTRR